MKQIKRIVSMLLAAVMIAAVIPVSVMADDTAITNLATQAQSLNESTGYIGTLTKTQCLNLSYGDVIYYAVRTGTSTNITSESALTKENYTCTYTKSAEEPFDPVRSIEMVFAASSSTSSRWWIKVTFIDKPVGAPDSLAVNGTFRITDGNSVNVTMAPKDYNYPLKLIAGDTEITNLGTQAQAYSESLGYITTLTKPQCAALSYGDVIYYAVRTGTSTNITDESSLTRSRYTCSYTKSDDEPFDPVSSAELVYEQSSSGKRWWIKVTFIDRPENAPSSLAVNGTFNITDNSAINVSMAPKSGNYPLTLVASTPEAEIKSMSTVPLYDENGNGTIDYATTGASRNCFIPFGTKLYYVLRSGTGSSTNITDDYTLDTSKYSISVTGSTGIDTNNVKIELIETDNGKYWCLAVPTLAQGSLDDPTELVGTVTITKIASSETAASIDIGGSNNIYLSNDTNPRPFNRISSNYIYAYDESGAVKSIAGSGATPPTMEYGDYLFWVVFNGSSSVYQENLDSLSVTLNDYSVEYIPGSSDSGLDLFENVSLSFENYILSGELQEKKRLFVKVETASSGPLAKADGKFVITRVADGEVLAQLDLSDAVPVIMDGESTETERGVLTASRVNSVLLSSTTGMGLKFQQDDDSSTVGYFSDLLIGSNVEFGESAYFLLLGLNDVGGYVPITEPDSVENMKFSAEYDQNGDKVESIGIVKKRFLGYGKYKPGHYFFVEMKIADKNNWTSRYTVQGDITMKKTGKHGINAPDNEYKFSVDFTVGPAKAHTETEDMSEAVLDDVAKRFEFGDGKYEEDKEFEIYLYGMSDDNYFTANTHDQPNILLGNNVEYNEEIGARYPDANLFFVNTTGKEFVHFGVMTLSCDEDTYIYERDGSMLKKVQGMWYDDDEGAYRIRTKKFASYVLSDTELDYDKYNISSVDPWARAKNDDGSISTLSGCEFNGANVEYGSTIYFTLRNPEEKTITDVNALDPNNFTFGFISNDPNSPGVKEAGIAFDTNLVKSTGVYSDRYYVAVKFAEVPDPGVPRTVSGDFVIYYKGEELTRLVMGPVDNDGRAADYTITLCGGRVVHDDWVPVDYEEPVLRTQEEIDNFTVSDGEDEEDPD